MIKKQMIGALCAVALLSACENGTVNKQTIGTVIGAAAGAAIGSNVGKGDGKTVGIALGTLAGAWLGSSVGQSLDELDRLKIQQTTQSALERQPTGQTSRWENPDSGNSGTITPTQTVYNEGTQEPCREYESTVTIDGRLETLKGMACRQPDGTWKTKN